MDRHQRPSSAVHPTIWSSWHGPSMMAFWCQVQHPTWKQVNLEDKLSNDWWIKYSRGCASIAPPISLPCSWGVREQKGRRPKDSHQAPPEVQKCTCQGGANCWSVDNKWKKSKTCVLCMMHWNGWKSPSSPTLMNNQTSGICYSCSLMGVRKQADTWHVSCCPSGIGPLHWILLLFPQHHQHWA